MTIVVLRPKAIKGLASAPADAQRAIDEVIMLIRQGLFPHHTKKLGGTTDGYRTRVGRWCVLFLLKEGTADITDIFLKKGSGDYRRRRQ